jgi:acetylornithine/N-succinyldiaminopimelate aminotransferase
LRHELERLVGSYPSVLKTVRGLGFMQGLELHPKEDIPAFAQEEKPAATQLVNRLHEAGVLTIPAGAQVVRLLPALNLSRQDAQEGLTILEHVLGRLAAGG